MTVQCRPIVAIIASCAVAGACTVATNSPPTTGGDPAPPRARNSCVDAVAREFKVPKENVKLMGGTTTMKDGIYIVTLSPGPGQPAVNCTVDDNGAVGEVIRAR
ncbi:hypothetical protein QTI66_04660 [Variovorax sp. J22R133]|uniref:hypothetical protein n=1 Tax=Variovorax brevis TaxID=3053503 RepID=UPI002576D3BC|nr:hypothetical protein [Variovorax sp. J22R133]MDM0111428.1 hypothetical protein [Variovorax sp. J22R133]